MRTAATKYKFSATLYSDKFCSASNSKRVDSDRFHCWFLLFLFYFITYVRPARIR